MAETLTCVKCSAPLLDARGGSPGVTPNVGHEMPCPACAAPTLIEAFPALFRKIEAGSAGEKIASTEEAACFYHPQKKAVVPCDSCGRFLCALCDVDLQGKHLCPNCLQTGKKKGKLRDLENERVLYDRIALVTAILPMIVWPVTFVTAPAALYLSIRHWNAPGSIVRGRSRARFIIAMILAVLQIGGWCTMIYIWTTR